VRIPFLKGKIDLGCVGESNSSKLQTILAPFKNLGIKSTLPNSIALIQSVEGVDWIVLQPKSFPSKKLSSNKGIARFKPVMKCGVVECQTGHIKE
jgi:hypothetical protein